MGLWEKLTGQKKSTVCVATCQIPSDILQGVSSSQLRALTSKCAMFAGNLVVDRYNIDPRNREVTAIDTPPSVGYKFTVADDRGVAVAEFTRQSWRELMDDIRRHGVQSFLKA